MAHDNTLTNIMNDMEWLDLRASIWRFEDAPEHLRSLTNRRDGKWILHCPKALADRLGDDLPAFMNGKIQEGNWRNFIVGLGFADHHDHPSGDGFVIIFTES